ncbi:hypothetical protein [Dactylosporangium sp. NPDC048998]|uniref:hypothetical protein n=1 Tax=Dactylosporangium sp. NPDC048998 TaxID=3363976 RepID=UPI0037152147
MNALSSAGQEASTLLSLSLAVTGSVLPLHNTRGMSVQLIKACRCIKAVARPY